MIHFTLLSLSFSFSPAPSGAVRLTLPTHSRSLSSHAFQSPVLGQTRLPPVSMTLLGGGGDKEPGIPEADPLQQPRPKYDLAACSGRPDERVWGAMAPVSPDTLGEWASDMTSKGIQRILLLLSAAEAEAGVPPGGISGFSKSPWETWSPAAQVEALAAEGFESSKVTVVPMSSVDARANAFEALNAAVAARETIVAVCADGHALTSIVLADFLLTDYIGGDNCLEACDLLAARKRKSGVERRPEAETLEAWIEKGTMA